MWVCEWEMSSREWSSASSARRSGSSRGWRGMKDESDGCWSCRGGQVLCLTSCHCIQCSACIRRGRGRCCLCGEALDRARMKVLTSEQILIFATSPKSLLTDASNALWEFGDMISFQRSQAKSSLKRSAQELEAAEEEEEEEDDDVDEEGWSRMKERARKKFHSLGKSCEEKERLLAKEKLSLAEAKKYLARMGSRLSGAGPALTPRPTQTPTPSRSQQKQKTPSRQNLSSSQPRLAQLPLRSLSAKASARSRQSSNAHHSFAHLY